MVQFQSLKKVHLPHLLEPFFHPLACLPFYLLLVYHQLFYHLSSPQVFSHRVFFLQVFFHRVFSHQVSSPPVFFHQVFSHRAFFPQVFFHQVFYHLWAFLLVFYHLQEPQLVWQEVPQLFFLLQLVQLFSLPVWQEVLQPFFLLQPSQLFSLQPQAFLQLASPLFQVQLNLVLLISYLNLFSPFPQSSLTQLKVHLFLLF